MTTEILPAGEKAVALAAQLLRAGQPVAIPTETVYGLAANALDAEAAARVFEAKGRPKDNPMIVHIDMLDRLPQVVSAFPREAQLLADAFWPGPLTLVLPKAAGIPDAVSAGLATVGVRLPAHRATRAVIAAAGLPLWANTAASASTATKTISRRMMRLGHSWVMCFSPCPCRIIQRTRRMRNRASRLRAYGDRLR